MNTTSTRKARRQTLEDAAHKNRVRKGAALSLAVLVGGTGLVLNPAAAMAADGDGKGTLSAWFSSDEPGQFVPDYADEDQLDLTATEAENLRKLMKGELDGEVKASASQAEQDAWKAKGVDLGLESASELSNKHLGDLDPETGVANYRLLLPISFDAEKNAAAAEALGIDPADAVVTVQALRGDGKNFMPNIATDEMAKAPTNIKAGDRIKEAPGGVIAHSPNYYADHPEAEAADQHLDTGAYYGPSLYPGVAITEESAKDSNGEFSLATTTLVDSYSDTMGPNRTKALTENNVRGMPANTDNCLDEDCGVWLVASINGIAIVDPIRIDVQTTVSAGEAPELGKEITFASGDKGRFVANGDLNAPGTSPGWEWDNGQDDPITGFPSGLGSYFNDEVGPWQLAAENIRVLAAIAEENALRDELGNNVRIDNIVANSDGSLSVKSTAAAFHNLAVQSDEGSGEFSMTIAPLSGYHELYGYNPVVPAWEYNGKVLEEGDTITINGVGEATVSSIDEGGIALWASNEDWSPAEDAENTHTPSFVRWNDESAFIGEGNLLHPTPGYSLEFEKAAETETPLPKPDAAPDTGTAKYGQAVDIDVIANDSFSEGFTLKEDSLRLISPETGKAAMAVAIKGQGEYKVAGEEVIRFTPEQGFTGKAERLSYTWVETNGDIEQLAGSTVQATILPQETPTTTPEPPQVDEPPVVTPPVIEEPPAVDPPVVEPPTDEPPVVDPPLPEEDEESEPKPPVIEEGAGSPPAPPIEGMVNAGFTGAGGLAGAFASLLAVAGALFGLRQRRPAESKVKTD